MKRKKKVKKIKKTKKSTVRKCKPKTKRKPKTFGQEIITALEQHLDDIKKGVLHAHKQAKRHPKVVTCPKCGQPSKDGLYTCPRCLDSGCAERCNPGGNGCLCAECEDEEYNAEE